MGQLPPAAAAQCRHRVASCIAIAALKLWSISTNVLARSSGGSTEAALREIFGNPLGADSRGKPSAGGTASSRTIGSSWWFLKKPINLTARQAQKLAEVLRYNLRTVRSYLLKEDFQSFWEYVSPYWAGRFLDQWCTRTMRSRIEPMKKVATMLRRHHELLLNWFRAKKEFSSGVVEGLNNKAKLAMKRAYGFRTFEGLEVALYHTLGNLPQPSFAHRFS